METDPFPAFFLSDIEYSVIMSDVIKSFDCILHTSHAVVHCICCWCQCSILHTQHMLLKHCKCY